MFCANLEDGTTISVMDKWHLEELKELRKKRSFYCPMCKEAVQLKLGRKRQWHFAHIANSSCDQTVENETMYHMNGKKQLYEWLKQQQVEAALEVYLPLIRQRPDILFRYDKSLYALEYQCAPIEPSLLEKRTSNYKQLGIIPIWILGGNRLKRHSEQTFSLKTFEWFSSRKNESDQYYLTYYCPNQQKIGYLEQLTPYTPTRLLAAYQEHPIQTLIIKNFLSPPSKKEFPFDYWLSIKKHWRYQHPAPYPTRTDLFIQQLLYRKRISPSLFPIEAGWPTDQHYVIESSPFQWQSFLLFECLQYQPLHHSFSSRIAKQCLQPYMNNGIFGHRQTLECHNWTAAVDGFLHWLCKLNYLEKVNGNDQYKRVRTITLPTSIEQAITLDRKCLYDAIAKTLHPKPVDKIKEFMS
ncbi:hypothetical protein GN156_02565 [bacterium LRH843]|nr:hypothetical protein [bacterium LRH843]